MQALLLQNVVVPKAPAFARHESNRNGILIAVCFYATVGGVGWLCAAALVAVTSSSLFTIRWLAFIIMSY